MPNVFVKDSYRQAVEAATGGKCTVLYDTEGYPSLYHNVARCNIENIDPTRRKIKSIQPVHPSTYLPGADLAQLNSAYWRINFDTTTQIHAPLDFYVNGPVTIGDIFLQSHGDTTGQFTQYLYNEENGWYGGNEGLFAAPIGTLRRENFLSNFYDVRKLVKNTIIPPNTYSNWDEYRRAYTVKYVDPANAYIIINTTQDDLCPYTSKTTTWAKLFSGATSNPDYAPHSVEGSAAIYSLDASSQYVDIASMSFACVMGAGTHPAFLSPVYNYAGELLDYITADSLYVSMYENIVLGDTEATMRLISLHGQSYFRNRKAYTPRLVFNDSTAEVPFREYASWNTYAKNKGAGFHIMSNWEYSVVALLAYAYRDSMFDVNAELMRGNVQSGMSGYQSGKYHEMGRKVGWVTVGDRGIDPYYPMHEAGPDTGGDIYGGSGPPTWRHDLTYAGIADLCGNSAELVTGVELCCSAIDPDPTKMWFGHIKFRKYNTMHLDQEYVDQGAPAAVDGVWKQSYTHITSDTVNEYGEATPIKWISSGYSPDDLRYNHTSANAMNPFPQTATMNPSGDTTYEGPYPAADYPETAFDYANYLHAESFDSTAVDTSNYLFNAPLYVKQSLALALLDPSWANESRDINAVINIYNTGSRQLYRGGWWDRNNSMFSYGFENDNNVLINSSCRTTFIP